MQLQELHKVLHCIHFSNIILCNIVIAKDKECVLERVW